MCVESETVETDRVVHDEVDHALLAFTLSARERVPVVGGRSAGQHSVGYLPSDRTDTGAVSSVQFSLFCNKMTCIRKQGITDWRKSKQKLKSKRLSEHKKENTHKQNSAINRTLESNQGNRIAPAPQQPAEQPMDAKKWPGAGRQQSGLCLCNACVCGDCVLLLHVESMSETYV